jgi:hypothetical protein
MPRVDCGTSTGVTRRIKGVPLQCNPDKEELIPDEGCGSDPGVRCFDSCRSPIDLTIFERSRVISFNLLPDDFIGVQNKYRTPNGTLLFSPIYRDSKKAKLDGSHTDIVLEKGSYRFTLNGAGDSVCLRLEGL